MPTTTRAARRYGAGTVVALGLLGSACASVSNPLAALTTARAVGESFGSLLDQPGLRAQISLGVSATQLRQLAQQAGTANAVSGAVLNGVSATSLVIDLHTLDGQNLSRAVGQSATTTKVAVDVALRVGSDTPVELRFISSSLFARADLVKTFTDYGQSPQRAASSEQALAKADASLPGVGALARGGWVSADLSPLQKLAHQQVTPATLQTGRSLIRDFESALRNNTTFSSRGTHGGRTEYTISVAAKGFVAQFLGGAVQALSADLPSGALRAVPGVANRISASQLVTVQDYVKGNKVEELDLDIAQFDRKLPFPVPVRVVFGAGATIAAPAGATPVDISKLTTLLPSLGHLSITNPGAQIVPRAQIVPGSPKPGGVSAYSPTSVATTAP